MVLDGKICMVTGATAGIGLVTARELARKGAAVIVVGRDAAKGERVVREIRAATDNERVGFQRADLSRQADIRRLAHEFADGHPRLDVLVNNVGAILARRQLSADGIEMTFALNHLSYFLLTHQLLPRLREAPAGRIVNVSSAAHRGAELDFDDLQCERGYSGWRTYQRSKLANLLFTYELARRLEGSSVTANALHPGFVASRFGLNNGPLFRFGIRIAFMVSAIPVDEGAQTSIHLASSPEVEEVNGKYFIKCEPAESSPASRDPAAARRLWEISEAMTAS